MNSTRKVVQVCNNNPQGSRQKRRPKSRQWNCVQTDINRCKIKNCKKRDEKEIWLGEVH